MNKRIAIMGVSLLVLVLGVSVVSADPSPPPDEGRCISADVQSQAQLLDCGKCEGDEKKECEKKKECDKAKKGGCSRGSGKGGCSKKQLT